MGCQFLNTHSIPVSAILGCNTNVQIREPCHKFYATAYVFKDTKKDESAIFLPFGAHGKYCSGETEEV